MDKNQNKGILYFSIFSGVFSFIVLNLLKDILEIPFEFTIMFPLIYAVGIWAIMPTIIQIQSRKYMDYEKKFKTRAIYMTVANLLMKQGQRNGRLYVFPGRLLFFSADSMPRIEVEITSNKIRYIQLIDDIDLAIVLESDEGVEKQIRFRIAEAKLLMENIKREVWLHKSIDI